MIVNNTLVIVQKPGGNNHKTLLINPVYEIFRFETYLPKISSNSPTPLNDSVSYINLKIYKTCIV